MPSFVCDYCQETLKKAKLDQHAQRCRQAVFSCIDCHTSFKGTEYRAHFSCITEVQKYHNKQTIEKTDNKSAGVKINDIKKIGNVSTPTPIPTITPAPTPVPTPTKTKTLASEIKKLFTTSSSTSASTEKSLSFKVVKKQLKKSLGKKYKKTLQEQLKFSFNQQTDELIIKLE